MSVLIKGMEMPQNCYTCNLCNYYNEPNQGCYCVALRADLHRTNIMKEREKNCPLIELPPHGRLIDIEPFMRGLYEEIQMGQITYTSQELYDMMDEEIKSMPTIIEAEEVDNG